MTQTPPHASPDSPPAETTADRASFPTLSVLDLVPRRADQTSADALASSIALAKVADEQGYRRYWVAEHHNTESVVATNPPVLMALLASVTERIRLGSGGVMLPNHAPLVVAEQFALLEAAFPGRIDLGLGRAPGTDPLTRAVLRGGLSDDAVNDFERHIDDVLMLMSPDGVLMEYGGRHQGLRATPKATSVPAVWLLGSSTQSAALAGVRGLPYVFAHHFSGGGTEQALALYRSTFRPSEQLDAPRTFLTVNAVVAEDDQTADRLALPYLQAIVALRTRGQFSAAPFVEDAEAVADDPARSDLGVAMRSTWVIGSPERARAQIAELAERFDVDEVMVNPVAGAWRGTPATSSPAREDTLRLLASDTSVA